MACLADGAERARKTFAWHGGNVGRKGGPMKFERLPIKQKMIAAILITSLAVLVLASVALLTHEIHSYRQTAKRTFSTMAELVAANSAAALMFDDTKTAREVLSGLRAEPDVKAAALFDKGGKLYASYPFDASPSIFPASPGADGVDLAVRGLTVVLPVIHNDDRAGTMYLRADLTEVYRRLQVYGMILLGVFAGGGVLAFVLSNFLQQRITQPLVELTQAAEAVSQKRDYSVRVAATAGGDEVGTLTAAFNGMLDQIQEGHAALRESEGRLSAVFQQAGEGIAQIDLAGHFVLVNDRFCEIAGRSREALLRMRVQDITHPEDLPLSMHAFERVIQEGAPSVLEKRYVQPDGASVWVRKSVSAMRDAAGQLESVLAVAQDITERRRTEAAVRASEEQLRIVSDHASVYLTQFDRAHRFRFVNRAYAERHGLEPHDVIGRHVGDVIGLKAYETIRPHMERALTGQRVEFETEMNYSTLGARWTHAIFMPQRSPDGEVSGVVGVVFDITARKRAELDLERARDEALAASRAKDDFLAALSHELRTPLNPVLLLASEAATNEELSPAVRADFEMISRNVLLEARLIDDLLDLTRITRGKLSLDLRPLDVHGALRDAIASVRGDIKAKRLELTLDLEAGRTIVVGDAIRLRQIFWNVLKNAVKFTPSGGSITVSTQVMERSHRLAVTIRDTGIGMTPQELGRVFESFAQGDHAGSGGSHRFGGLGLGLSISRMLAELHHGSIRAESEGRGQGSTFTVELPLTRATVPVQPQESPRPVATAGADAAGKQEARGHFLLVEDHVPSRDALAHLLKRRGYQVTAAGSLGEARECAEREKFDLLISDIGLPDGSGNELMAEFRERYGLRGIALTGYGMEQDVVKSQMAGFVAHLTKPVRLESLEQALVSAQGARMVRQPEAF